MNNEIEVYTFTMAKLYTDQGHFAKAEAVYRHLLEKDPDNPILKEALESVAGKRASRKARQDGALATLFKEWMDLTQEYNRRKKQKKRGDRSG